MNKSKSEQTARPVMVLNSFLRSERKKSNCNNSSDQEEICLIGRASYTPRAAIFIGNDK